MYLLKYEKLDGTGMLTLKSVMLKSDTDKAAVEEARDVLARLKREQLASTIFDPRVCEERIVRTLKE